MKQTRGTTAGSGVLDQLRREPTWVLLPLRLFLGFTFTYAGLSKIADRTFLDDSSPLSMHASVVAVKRLSPIGGLLGPVVDHSFLFGVLMSLGETAVGIGVLLGLFTRIAALGGVGLALSLFLTVSWNASPWYTGADIVYAFAMTPLLLAGPTPLSADLWLASVRQRRPDVREDRTRRGLLALGAGVAGLIAVGAASLFRSSAPSSTADATTSTPTPTPTPSASGASGPTTSSAGTSAPGTTAPGTTATGAGLIAASAVSVGGGKQINDPTSGDPVWVLQLQAGQFTAYSATCPHQGCAVAFVSGSAGFACPCHGSTFASDGKVTQGPATRDLTSIAVIDNAGQITKN